MKSQLLSAALAGAALVAFGAPASAQSYGLTANTPGICILNSGQLISQSAVGKAVDARLKQLGAQVNSELTPEKTAIETEDKSLAAALQAATTDASRQALGPRVQALETRIGNFQQKGSLRQAELQATQQKALAQVSDQARPAIKAVAAQKSCALVLDAAVVADANPAMDITAAAVAALDGRIKTLTFERERLDTQAARPAQ